MEENGNRILHDQIRHRYGVNGRAFGGSIQDRLETVQLPQNVADAAEHLLIMHYNDPKINLVALVIEIAGVIWQVIQMIQQQQQQGEQVNAGSDPM